MTWRRTRNRLFWALALIAAVQTVFWLTVARPRFEDDAYFALINHHAPHLGPSDDFDCVVVEPERRSVGVTEAWRQLEAELSAVALELLSITEEEAVAAGYDPERCIRYWIQHYEAGLPNTLDLPLVSRAVISNFAYDFNGYSVWMLQLGPRWVFLRSGGVWF